MNSKTWIRKALSTCLVTATIATSSMIALANTEKMTGELLISGGSNNETSFVKVNGEAAYSGRSIFSSSTIATPENAGAVINLGKIGQVELAPDTNLTLSFNEKGIDGNLLSGRVTVLSAENTVGIKTLDGSLINLNAGESAVATSNKAQDDDTDSGGNGAMYAWIAILGGAAAGIIIAATSDNNRTVVGGGATVVNPVSPTR